MEGIKISIVTTTYNSVATLRDTLQSILSQSYTNYEVLIQDGCSTDGTLDVVNEFASSFGDRLKLAVEPDGGIYDAMNRGIRRATGEVIGMLNSDDFFTSPDVLATIARTFGEQPALDAVYADVHYVNEQDLGRVVRYYSSAQFTPERVLRGFMPAHPTFYIRRHCFDRYGLYDLDMKLASDFEFALRLIYKYRIRTQYVPQDWVTMRLGGASTSGLRCHLHIISDHLKAFRKHGIPFRPWLYFSRYWCKLKEYR